MGLLDGTTQSAYYSGNDFGNYQFVSLDDIITQFQIAYVGEGKIIPKIKRTDVAFHAQRALQELSFDTFKSFKAQEIVVPATLQMILPQDYVNYTKVSWVDSAGIKHLLYPMSKTSNPPSIVQDATNGIYSPIVSGFNQGLATDETNITYGTGIAKDETNNQVDFTAAPQFHKLNWNNVSGLEVGKSYTLTYTISNVPYIDPTTATIPTIFPRIVDEFDNYVNFTARSQNGTYTETIEFVAGAIISPTQANRFYLEVTNVAFTGSVSDIALVESTDVPLNSESTTWSNYKSGTPSENQDDYQDDTYWPMNGNRYGLDPQYAQANGSFYIDNNSGKIHFSSNISGKTVVLDYISDGLGTDNEMQVHKFAEEAMYKCIAHAIISTSSFGQQLVPRLTKEKFAAVRKAKLRLSNIKLEEITQVLRGKSKQIKH
jgi:hypothetical protein